MPKRHILIVDDNDDIRSLIRTTLGNAIYNIGQATNGQEALDYLDTHDLPDLIILDMAMPMMSGLEVLEHIKNEPEMAHIEVIILSAQANEVNERQALGMGARAVIAKPFGPLQLLRMLDEIFD